MSRPNSIDRKTLGERLARREFWGEVFGWMVGAGLLIEYWKEIVDCFTKRQLPPWPLVGGLLVTLGVLGEVWFSRLANKTTEEIQERADSDVALANERAANAVLAAAEANRRTEQERLARVKIEEKLAERGLTPKQTERIRSSLQSFSGRRVTLASYPNDQESARLVAKLVFALGPPLETTDASECLELALEANPVLFGIKVFPDIHDSILAEALTGVLSREAGLCVEPLGPVESGREVTMIAVGYKPPVKSPE